MDKDATGLPFGFAPPQSVQTSKKTPPLRPFVPGEKIANLDGSYSTEVTITVEDGNGGYMVIPQLWMGPSGVIDLRGKQGPAIGAAMHLRDNFGYKFPTFKTIEEADAYASQRSDNKGAYQGSIAQGGR